MVRRLLPSLDLPQLYIGVCSRIMQHLHKAETLTWRLPIIITSLATTILRPPIMKSILPVQDLQGLTLMK